MDATKCFIPGETIAGTGLGKATGRAGERSKAPEANMDAGADEDVKDGLAEPTASLEDAKPLPRGFEAGESG